MVYKTLNGSRLKYNIIGFKHNGKIVYIRDYRKQASAGGCYYVQKTVNLQPRERSQKKRAFIPPKIKTCNNELLHYISYNNLITDDAKIIKKLLKFINTPVIIYDFDNTFINYKNAVNVIYYGDYLKDNTTRIIENRIARKNNKADKVTIIINSIDDYKPKLNYLIKRGRLAGVNILAVADAIPKKHLFNTVYSDGTLKADGELFKI